jgi:hypothetical protein
MNAEQFHDALTLLPGDLITAADKYRTSSQKRIIPWRRYAAMAACLALICCSVWWLGLYQGPSSDTAAQMESAMDQVSLGLPSSPGTCAPQESVNDGAPKAPAEGDRPPEPAATSGAPDEFYIGGSSGFSPAPGHKEGMEYPYSTLIRSREELDGWYAEHRDFYVIDSFEAGYAELEADFFQAHDLILVMLEEEYGYVYHEPYYLNRQQDGKWKLSFTAHYQQEDRTSDPMQWLFVIEIEKGLINETDAIEILPEPYAVPEETE